MFLNTRREGEVVSDSTLLPNRAGDEARRFSRMLDRERSAVEVIYDLVRHCEHHGIGTPSSAARYANDLRLAALNSR